MKWYLRRLDNNIAYMKKVDSSYVISDDAMAHQLLYQSGLDRKEQRKVFKKADQEWDPKKIREALLKEHEMCWELDVQRVCNAAKNKDRHNAHKSYVVDDLSNGIAGTDLLPEDVCSETLDEQCDLSSGVYDPVNPVMLATEAEQDAEEVDQSDVYFVQSDALEAAGIYRDPLDVPDYADEEVARWEQEETSEEEEEDEEEDQDDDDVVSLYTDCDTEDAPSEIMDDNDVWWIWNEEENDYEFSEFGPLGIEDHGQERQLLNTYIAGCQDGELEKGEEPDKELKDKLAEVYYVKRNEWRMHNYQQRLSSRRSKGKGLSLIHISEPTRPL